MSQSVEQLRKALDEQGAECHVACRDNVLYVWTDGAWEAFDELADMDDFDGDEDPGE